MEHRTDTDWAVAVKSSRKAAVVERDKRMMMMGAAVDTLWLKADNRIAETHTDRSPGMGRVEGVVKLEAGRDSQSEAGGMAKKSKWVTHRSDLTRMTSDDLVQPEHVPTGEKGTRYCWFAESEKGKNT